jgi:hypothetical protein
MIRSSKTRETVSRRLAALFVLTGAGGVDSSTGSRVSGAMTAVSVWFAASLSSISQHQECAAVAANHLQFLFTLKNIHVKS